MPLIRWCRISLSLEHVSQMTATSRAHDLRPAHTECAIGVSCHGSRDIIEVCGPSAAGFELVIGFVERSFAAGAGVDAFAGHVFVVDAGVGSFGALFTEDTELFCEGR